MTLVKFVYARIAEDETAARSASLRDFWGDGPSDGAHIARWLPARVLAECEVKRRIVDEHKPTKPKYSTRMERGCLTCGTAQGWDDRANEANCNTLRLLALPYADHPEFREEWRP